MICPMDKCQHYLKATKYPKKCYYRPQCWKGELDIVLMLLKKVGEG